MELTEITTITYPHIESPLYFSLSTAGGNHQDYAFMCRNAIELLTLKYKNCENTNFLFVKRNCAAPNSMPTNDLNVDVKKIYYKSDQADCQQLCLDPVLLPALAPSRPTIGLISAKWSPFNSTSGSYIAGLTNCGGCEIQRTHTEFRSDRNEKINISEIWLKYCVAKYKQMNPIDNFQDLQTVVSDVHITAICFYNLFRKNSSLFFATISASGLVAVFDIPKCSLYNPIPTEHIDLVYTGELNLTKVNCVAWIGFRDSKQQPKSLLFASDIIGNLSMYEVTIEDDLIRNIELKSVIWNYSDETKFTEIAWEYDDDSHKLYIVTCKGSHVIVFIFEENGALHKTLIHNAQHLFINGLCKMQPLKYVICTLGSSIQCLTISADDTILVEYAKCNINFDKYILYSIVVSKNASFWLLSLYPRHSTDHLVVRQPTTISICAPSSSILIQKLIENKTKKLTDLYDCIEVLRFIDVKNGDIPDELLNFDLRIDDGIIISDDYLYKLKLRMIFCNSKSAYFKRKLRIKESNYLRAEFKIIQKTLFAINYYRKLRQIVDGRDNNNLMDLANIQKLSMKCLKIFLIKYINEDEFYDAFVWFRDQLKPLCEDLFEKIKFLDSSTVPELCTYCNEFIEDNSFMCKDLHDVPRCSITLIQLPLENIWYCQHCAAPALGSNSDLQMGLQPTTCICLICDIPINS